MSKVRNAPRQCPVCGDVLALTKLSCHSCGTELSGDFEQCEFCALTADDRQLLRVFLASRGNMKDLERHLAVSYPTARARFDSLLGKLAIDRPAPDNQRAEVLESLARGEIDVDEAMHRLEPT
ncbi:MAG: DUF2089 domain-containing protein [Chloroflexi bacterium]|nr:MAG: DUF2089 domain-containing protein [Chloroflexota bacterium]TME14171.1 MAG: DUF2089 domain-containing protein [Chloroflexota bacterium]TME17630.1 MAG: DUF2089 domain-containing protein [Chloroflexota bacterium]